MPKFGPGTLKFGGDADELEVSCLVNSCTISSDNDTGDSTTKLCGTVVPGAITFTYTLGGNVDLDSNDARGLFALSQSAKGQLVPFDFTPHDEGTSAAGVVRITPLDFGGDDFGTDMTSDFEWDIVGEPDYTYPDSQTQSADWWEPFVFTDAVPGPVYAATLSSTDAAASSSSTPPADAASSDTSADTSPDTAPVDESESVLA